MIFRKKYESPELWVHLNGQLLKDNNPTIEYGMIRSEKLRMAFPYFPPVSLCNWRRGKEPGEQPDRSSNERMIWLVTGGKEEELANYRNSKEFDRFLDLIYESGKNRALKEKFKARRRNRLLNRVVNWMMLGVTALLVASFIRYLWDRVI